MKWFRVAGIYLTVQLVLFVCVKFIFRATWHDLIGPYLVFAVSMAGTFFMVWLINALEWDRTAPRWFAFGAAFTILYLGLSANVAFAYLGIALGLLSLNFALDWTNWIYLVLPFALLVSVSVYRQAYRMSKSRVAKKFESQ